MTMNLSQNNTLLKQIDTKLNNNIYVGITETQSLVENIDLSLSNINTSLNNIETNSNTLASAVSSSEFNINITNLTAFTRGIGNAGAGTLNVAIARDDPLTTDIANIEANLTSIQNELIDIGTSMADLSQININNKTYVEHKVLWNTATTLAKSDYTSSAVVGQYQNTTGSTMYITKYTFSYWHSDASLDAGKMYHADTFTTKIGRYDGTNFQTPFIDCDRNRFHYMHHVKTDLQDASSNTLHLWNYDFSQHPIAIPNNEYFGHQIGGDLAGFASTSNGMCQGYY